MLTGELFGTGGGENLLTAVLLFLGSLAESVTEVLVGGSTEVCSFTGVGSGRGLALNWG